MLSATIQRRMISSKIPSLFCPMLLSNIDATNTSPQFASTAHRASISISSGRIVQNSQYSSLATNNIKNSLSRNELPNFTRYQSIIKHANTTIRTNFSYAGPRRLSDILKVELLTDKSAAEIVSTSSIVLFELMMTICNGFNDVRCIYEKLTYYTSISNTHY